MARPNTNSDMRTDMAQNLGPAWHWESPQPQGNNLRALWGIPVSAGVVEGPVRVVRTVEESRAVRPGDVLVAPFTDVGWTPCFPVIAGLVTELGSPLSHGAVVAREYGLPAVVSVRGATTALRSGDRVRVDGLRGIVERLD